MGNPDDMFNSAGGYAEDMTGFNFGNSSSADQALRAQQDASRDANATQRYIYDSQRADNQPWRDTGVNALGRLNDNLDDYTRSFTMADFQQDPGYQFRMQEGQKALESSAAARGSVNSGATMKALSRYGQDFASNEYTNAVNRFNNDQTNRFNRLTTLAGLGQTANAQNAQAGQNYANQYGQNVIGAANAQAAQTVAQANQRSGMIQNGATMAMMFSDERLKTNIEAIPKEDLREMKSMLKAYAFNYKKQIHGHGDWVGVMAQDLEKSKLGRTLVIEDANGNKQIDVKKVMSMFLATMAEG